MIRRTEVPVELGREEAQRLAEAELADPRYHADDPSLPQQGVRWLLDRLAEMLARAGELTPGGYSGLALLGLIAVLTVIAIRLAVGPISRIATRPDHAVVFEQRPRSAAEYRHAADAHAARAQWADAIRARFRAIVRDLEQRDLLDPRPGRTADEAATVAAAVLPQCGDALREAARIFGEVCYGGRRGTSEMDLRLREVDEAARRAQPVVDGAEPARVTAP